MLDRPQHRLRASSQGTYTSPAVFAEEQAAIFDEDWVMVARAGALAQPGAYLTARLGPRPVAVVRQDDGTLRAFANVCLHRYARLLDGVGRARRIVCPYHAWTYDLAGRLIGLPDRDGFCAVATRDLALEELACEEHLGFVFVALRHGLTPVATRLAALSELLAPYRLATWQDRHIVHQEVWEGNWKFVVENFIESYHTTYAHKGSIGPTNPTDLAERGPTGHAHFNTHSNSYRPEDLPPVHNPRLGEADRNKFHVVGLYPNGLAAVDANFMWWMALEPVTAERTQARWGLSFAPEAMAEMADAEDFVARIRRTIEIATVEDKEMVARAQDGAGFGDTTIALAGDFSNGNDGIVSKTARSVAGLEGGTIHLFELTVSHYLLSRALEENGLSLRDVNTVNITDADITPAYVGSAQIEHAVAWNPMLMTMNASVDGSAIIFDSSSTPEEIVDVMLFHTETVAQHPDFVRAVVGAWYETMQIMSGAQGEEARAEMIADLADMSGGSVEDFQAQLDSTRMYYDPKDAYELLTSERHKKTWDFVRTFSYDVGLFGEMAESKDFVGIEFPDGDILGNPENVKLRINADFTAMAVNGDL